MCPRPFVKLLQPSSIQCDVGPVRDPMSYCQPTSICHNPVLCWPNVCPPQSSMSIASLYLSPGLGWSSVCPHRTIVILPIPASIHCYVGSCVYPHRSIFNLLQPLCVPIELSLTALTQCNVGPVCVPMSYCKPTSTCLNLCSGTTDQLMMHAKHYLPYNTSPYIILDQLQCININLTCNIVDDISVQRSNG